MNTRKILEISGYPPPYSGWGVRVQYVKRDLEKLGHICKVLNMGVNRRVPSPEYICVHNAVDYFFKVCWYAIKGYTIHAHVNGDSIKGLLLSLVAAFASLIGARRCVLTFHAGPTQRFFPKERSGNYFVLFYLLFRISKNIICNNEQVKNNIAGYGVSKTKIWPIPAFSVQYLSYIHTELPQDINMFLEQSNPVIFTYIRLRHEFDLETLLSGIQILSKRFHKLGVLVCGTGGSIDDDSKRTFYEKIKELDIANNLLLIEDLPRDLFQTVLCRADIYLRTPMKDGVCSSVLEALYHKIPVVASENGSRPRSVVGYCAGNPADLAKTIITVLDNYHQVKDALERPQIKDTVIEEIGILTQ